MLNGSQTGTGDMHVPCSAHAVSVPERLEGGLRCKGVKKNAQPGRPLISIITATFNAVEQLSNTIKSIRELTYDNLEWIVVDGASRDNTVDLIRRNESVIDYWVSEPDSGIYDAWNKGVSLARGEWIAFLGDGDVYKPDAIEVYTKAIRASEMMPELVTSRVRFVNSDGVVLRVWGTAFNWSTFKKYMNIAHPGALHHKSLFEKHGLFDSTYSSAADYEFLMRCGANLKTLYLDEVTVDMLTGGVSNSSKGIFETYNIQKRYGAGIAAESRLCLAYVKSLIRPLLRGY